MLGPGNSSLSYWTPWATMATALVRYVRWKVEIAWKRTFSSSLVYARCGDAFSQVNGLHIVKGVTTPSTKPSLLEMWNETARVIRLEYDRKISEPLGGITSCLADIVLENTDNRFTPNHDSTIGTALLPKRPVTAEIGFYADSTERNISIFKGLSQMPEESKAGRTLTIPAKDYVEFLNSYALEPAIYVDKRTDEIIEDILITAGFSAPSYELDEALNTPSFVHFDRDETAGDRIRVLCEAEEGHFFQDENAVLRYHNRRRYGVYPYTTSMWDINPSDIIAWETMPNTQIINKCTVRTQPRTVQDLQEVWRRHDEFTIAIGATATVLAKLSDPCLVIAGLIATTDYTAYTGEDSTGLDKTADMVVTTEGFATEVKITIKNNSGALVYIPLLKIRGKPATVEGPITATYEDSSSINKYDLQEFSFENDYIDDAVFALALVTHVVNKYKEPLRRVRLTVQGQPHFQVKDKVRVKDPDTSTFANYRIMQIQGTLSEGLFIQDLIVRAIEDNEYDS